MTSLSKETFAYEYRGPVLANDRALANDPDLDLSYRRENELKSAGVFLSHPPGMANPNSPPGGVVLTIA